MARSTEPKEHILRVALPWRTEADGLTECGLDARDCRAVTRAQMERKVAEQGQARASFTSCMTCWSAVRDNRRAEQRLGAEVAVIRRALDRYDSAEVRRLQHDFTAIRLLVAAHRDEFDTTVRDLEGAVDLTAARRAAGNGGKR